jgi:Rieske 2Fe-2S family protein
MTATTPSTPAPEPSAKPAAQPMPAALSPQYYLDEALLEAEQRLIFERTWQLVGHIGSLPQTGSYITARAGSQPVLVVRDEGGVLRAYRNVCRHRGSRLLSGSGQCKAAIRCRYHGWTYKLDGTMIGAPEALAYGDRLKKPELGLFPARVEEMCGLVFVNLDPHATPLAELLGDLPQRLERFGIPNLQSFAPYEGEQPANWKIVADNYLEGYHVPIAHPGLMRLYDYKNYTAEVHDNYVWFEAPLRDKPSSNRLERAYQRLVRPMPGLGPDDRQTWRYVYIYPNTTIDLYPDQINTWQLMPEGVGATHDVAASYRPAGSGARTRFVQWANQRLNTLVLDEDVDLVSNVQQGMRTRGYKCGPLSERERAVAWFAERIRTDLESAVQATA